MTPAIRHFRDKERFGDRTACGLTWERPPSGVVRDCSACLRVLREPREAVGR